VKDSPRKEKGGGNWPKHSWIRLSLIERSSISNCRFQQVSPFYVLSMSSYVEKITE